MIVLGLTGSIGMGKSTAAELFSQSGVAVFDADRSVHDIYNGPVTRVLSEMYPGAVKEGRVDRKALGALVLGNQESMARLEAIVHPLVEARRTGFIHDMRGKGDRMIVLDIPLLFEAGGVKEVDGIVVVTAGVAEQRRRVLARPGMSEDKFVAILDRQIPDREKRARAHFVVQTRTSLESTKRQIGRIISTISGFDRERFFKARDSFCS